MDREKLVEAMARAICEAFRQSRMQRGGHLPTWGELNDPKWAIGRMHAEEYREQARAALAVAEPVVREDERAEAMREAAAACLEDRDWFHWDGNAEKAAAIRALPLAAAPEDTP